MTDLYHIYFPDINFLSKIKINQGTSNMQEDTVTDCFHDEYDHVTHSDIVHIHTLTIEKIEYWNVLLEMSA